MSVATLAERLATRIAAHGPLGVGEFVDAALYDETHGFYATDGRAGRRGDFLTAPEVGPLFGAVIARALDAWWVDAGRPDRWTVIEHGAGPATLVRAVLAAEPECLRTGALRWVAVDRSASQLGAHPVHPSVVSTTSAPTSGDADVVFANELLDNLAFDIAEKTVGGWAEVLVWTDPDGSGGRFDLVIGGAVEVPPSFERMDRGVRLPVQTAARRWLADVRERHPQARVVVFDYGASTAELASRQGGWLRTFRSHEDGGDWLSAPGTCDITTDVDLDQLQVDHRATTVATQAEFLRRHGIDELVAQGRAGWHERAGVGDLAALRARSRIREADALLDPEGMGAFTVLEWAI